MPTTAGHNNCVCILHLGLFFLYRKLLYVIIVHATSLEVLHRTVLGNAWYVLALFPLYSRPLAGAHELIFHTVITLGLQCAATVTVHQPVHLISICGSSLYDHASNVWHIIHFLTGYQGVYIAAWLNYNYNVMLNVINNTQMAAIAPGP